MRLNRDMEYALISLTAMAGEKRVFSARELGENFGISFDLVSKILQRLAAHDIITSIQGPKGGYVLERSINSVSLKEVLSALAEKTSLLRCMNPGVSCEIEKKCNIKNGAQLLNRRWHSILSSFTLGDFVETQFA